MKRKIGLLALLAVVVLAAGSLLLAEDNPFVGTWQLNVAKSKYDPGPAPKSQTRKWDADGKVMVEGINAMGKATSYGYIVNGDNKAHPTIGAVPNTADMATSKRVNADTFVLNFTKAGKHVETATFKVSNGGKTLTITAKGATEKGAFNNTLVWDKQ